MSKVLSVRVPDELAVWADGYAESRGVSRQVLLEGALQAFRAECESGVPDLKRRIRERDAVRPGECSCPVLPGVREGDKPVVGFSGACPAHGRTREEFAVAVAERAELFRGLRAPLSVRSGKASKEPGGSRG